MSHSLSHRRISLQTRHCSALILAGGKGSRLSPLTETRCKPAVPFGGKYRIIDFTLSNCMNSGIRAVGVLTQYLPYELIEHCRLTWGWTTGVFGDAVSPLPAFQGPDGQSWFKGTADAVYQYIDQLTYLPYKFVLVLSGDHIYKMDYGEMLSEHINTRADITVGVIDVPLESARRFGVVQLDEQDRICHFQEKPQNPVPDPNHPDKAMASMGIYIFGRDLLIELLRQDHHNTGSKHDFGKDILPAACQSLLVKAFRFENTETEVQKYWRDVGTLDSYYDANMDLIGLTPDLDLYDRFWPIWAHQLPAPGVKFVFNDQENGYGMALNSVCSGGSIITGQVMRSLLFNFCRVKKHALVEDSLLLPNVTVGRECVLLRTIVDSDCKIPDGLQVGTDMELDRQRFHVTEQGRIVITKPMLDALAQTE